MFRAITVRRCCGSLWYSVSYSKSVISKFQSQQRHDLSLRQFTCTNARPSSAPTMNSPIPQAYARQMDTRRYRIGMVVAVRHLVSFTLYQFSVVPSSTATTRTGKPHTSHPDANPTQPSAPLDSALPCPDPLNISRLHTSSHSALRDLGSFEEDRLTELMDVAIKSMHNRGLHNQDVS
jgi:hypothetical protein